MKTALPFAFVAVALTACGSAEPKLDRSGYVQACKGGDRLAGTAWIPSVAVVELWESNSGGRGFAVVGRRGVRCAAAVDKASCEASWTSAEAAGAPELSVLSSDGSCGGAGCLGRTARAVLVEEGGVVARVTSMSVLRAKQGELTPANAAFLVAKGAANFCTFGTRPGDANTIDVLYTADPVCGKVVTSRINVSIDGTTTVKESETDAEGYRCV